MPGAGVSGRVRWYLLLLGLQKAALVEGVDWGGEMCMWRSRSSLVMCTCMCRSSM
jgi:hypothetical protein